MRPPVEDAYGPPGAHAGDNSLVTEAAVREQVAREIEADRMPLTAASGTEARAWQIGHNKGIADAARIARGEI